MPRAAATPPPSRKRMYHSDQRSPSPTPRAHKAPTIENDTTNLLLDFTEQIEAFSSTSTTSTSQRRTGHKSPVKLQSQSHLLSYINGQRSPTKATGRPSTPVKSNILNLLDFELPPAPTPRSIPTITIRELESLKSQTMSEISNLKATLSGKCAEVESLNRAVNDAERRAGEAQEAFREERSARAHAENEKADWEKKGKEVEQVLQSIKEEVINHERTMDKLERKVEESDRRADDAEARAADADARAADAEARATEAERKLAAASATNPSSNEGPSEEATAEHVAQQVQKQLDERIGAISSELHAVYKKKHETKVATLKKSYENRAERKCAELQKKIDELTKQNEELQIGKDATFSGVLPSNLSSAERASDMKRLEEQQQEIEKQRSKVVDLKTEIKAVRAEHKRLISELDKERMEKGELVAAVDEMLALQADEAESIALEETRKTTSRASGLRAPGSASGTGAESKIGKIAPGGLTRSVSGGKSRIMSNIERMGSGSSRTTE